MTQEEKQLLLKDLCGRLPYKVMVKSVGENKILGLCDLKDIDNLPLPYLRPMSSMTEEESKEYRMFIDYSYNDFTSESTPCVYVDKIENYIDWLNAHHFDYRGLIEKGLALEAPEDMYKTE